MNAVEECRKGLYDLQPENLLPFENLRILQLILGHHVQVWKWQRINTDHSWLF